MSETPRNISSIFEYFDDNDDDVFANIKSTCVTLSDHGILPGLSPDISKIFHNNKNRKSLCIIMPNISINIEFVHPIPYEGREFGNLHLSYNPNEHAFSPTLYNDINDTVSFYTSAADNYNDTLYEMLTWKGETTPEKTHIKKRLDLS